MHKPMSTIVIGLAAQAALTFAMPAGAEEDESPTVAVPVAASASSPRANPLRATALDVDSLARRRGGSGLSDMKLNGVVADNRAINVTTGSNLVTEGAFTNASGLPMLIQNTGNNVLIQNATIVNVHVN